MIFATQQIVQSLVNQLGVDSAQANISTTSSVSISITMNKWCTVFPYIFQIHTHSHFMHISSSLITYTVLDCVALVYSIHVHVVLLHTHGSNITSS